jgi:hypothetical protein
VTGEGPGRAASVRIPPEAAVRSGTFDALALLTVWFVRKSAYGVLFFGVIVLVVVGRTDEVGDEHSLGGYWHSLVSPAAGIILALVIRLASALAALALAHHLARSYERGLPPRTGFGQSIGTRLDRLHVTRAYRSLRWTHHVRQVAIARLGKTGAHLARLDPILDVINITFLVATIVALIVVGNE